MNKSEQLDELAKALVSARAVVNHPPRNKVNPHFRNRYADLTAVLDAVVPAFTANGLSIVQTVDGGQLVTTLLHTSGQFITSAADIPAHSNAQQLGSALTYLRRYSLAAMLGIVSDEDTDGEPARNSQLDKQNGTKSESTPPGDSLPLATKAQLKKLHTIGTKYYGDEWDDKRPALVQAITDNRSRSSNDLTKAECSRLIEGITLKFETEEAE